MLLKTTARTNSDLPGIVFLPQLNLLRFSIKHIPAPKLAQTLRSGRKRRPNNQLTLSVILQDVYQIQYKSKFDKFMRFNILFDI